MSVSINNKVFKVRGQRSRSWTACISTVWRRRSLPSTRQHPSYGDCLEVKREYYQNCSVLGCDTMFTVSSTLIWAVLTGL